MQPTDDATSQRRPPLPSVFRTSPLVGRVVIAIARPGSTSRGPRRIGISLSAGRGPSSRSGQADAGQRWVRGHGIAAGAQREGAMLRPGVLGVLGPLVLILAPSARIVQVPGPCTSGGFSARVLDPWTGDRTPAAPCRPGPGPVLPARAMAALL